jgi:hypothetical protein
MDTYIVSGTVSELATLGLIPVSMILGFILQRIRSSRVTFK